MNIYTCYYNCVYIYQYMKKGSKKEVFIYYYKVIVMLIQISLSVELAGDLFGQEVINEVYFLVLLLLNYF